MTVPETRVITSTHISLVDGSHVRHGADFAELDGTCSLNLSGRNRVSINGTRDQLRHLARSILSCTESMTTVGEEPARCTCCHEAPCTPGRTMCEECCDARCDPEYACELPMREREAAGL